MTLDKLVQLIEIQASCVQQLTDGQGLKLDWQVFNQKGEVLFTLPKRLNEEEIFIIQDYVKKFEKLGFDAGQKYANELKDREIDTIEKDYKVEMMRMKAENDRISSMLDKYMLENMIASDAECEQSKIGIPIHML